MTSVRFLSRWSFSELIARVHHILAEQRSSLDRTCSMPLAIFARLMPVSVKQIPVGACAIDCSDFGPVTSRVVAFRQCAERNQ